MINTLSLVSFILLTHTVRACACVGVTLLYVTFLQTPLLFPLVSVCSYSHRASGKTQALHSSGNILNSHGRAWPPGEIYYYALVLTHVASKIHFTFSLFKKFCACTTTSHDHFTRFVSYALILQGMRAHCLLHYTNV